jgi:hypothetical protein
MAKTDPAEAQKAAPPPPPPPKKKEKKKKEKPVKQKLEVPPLVDLTIVFSRSAFLLVTVLVALISFSAGCDLQTIFVRTMVSMIVTGLIMWLASWWVTQQVIEDHLAEQKAKKEEEALAQAVALPVDEGLLNDVKA